MSTLLVVPLKKTFEVDVVEPLKNLIQNSYNGNNANAIDHSDAITEFDELRRSALGRAFGKPESLEIMYNYYDQLCVLETKIPMHKLNVPFKWRDAFERKVFRCQRTNLTLTSLAYEKACVLFNIAALQSAIAASQGTYRDDGFKLATKLLQQSAGIFAHLKSTTSVVVQQEFTFDLNSKTLGLLSNLMLAQAQEIFVLKAIKHHMKESTVAQLATSCKDSYDQVLRDLQKDAFRSIWDKNWIATVAGKQAGFHAIAQLYQSFVCRHNKTIGEEIARLQNAVELFKVAQSRSGKPNLYEEFATRAQQNLDESKKDNDCIYNEIIPDVKTLNEPDGVKLVKVFPFTTPLSSNSKDLFMHLVPVVLHEAITASNARKNEFVNTEVMRLREATQILNESLASLNLPAAIEVISDYTLPQSILDNVKDIRKMGGIENLRTLINELPDSLKRNQEILDESDRMLNEEAEDDTRLRTQFKEKWTRTPSEKLTKQIRLNISKYREIMRNAYAADKNVHKEFDRHKKRMELLSLSSIELKKEYTIVSGNGSGNNNTNDDHVQKLKRLMNIVDMIQCERETIKSELMSLTVVVPKGQILHAMPQKGAAASESMHSDKSIEKLFATLRNRTTDNILRQESLIKHIQAIYRMYKQECRHRLQSRDAFINDLSSAYRSFVELQTHLKEGVQFYNDLTHLLLKFQNKIDIFCSARETEKNDLLTFMGK